MLMGVRRFLGGLFGRKPERHTPQPRVQAAEAPVVRPVGQRPLERQMRPSKSVAKLCTMEFASVAEMAKSFGENAPSVVSSKISTYTGVDPVAFFEGVRTYGPTGKFIGSPDALMKLNPREGIFIPYTHEDLKKDLDFAMNATRKKTILAKPAEFIEKNVRPLIEAVYVFQGDHIAVAQIREIMKIVVNHILP